MAAKLTATSFAILALLSRRDWSAYELNQHMQRSTIRVFWPRAQSHVYSEPKKLAKLGLVEGRDEVLNGRERSVYSITADGRQRLQEWLGEANATPLLVLQSEVMLKFLHADVGSIESLQQQLDGMIEETRKEISLAVAGIEDVLARHEGRETVVGMLYNGNAMALMADMLLVRLQWLQEVRAKLGGLQSTEADAEATAIGREAYRCALATLRTALDD